MTIQSFVREENKYLIFHNIIIKYKTYQIKSWKTQQVIITEIQKVVFEKVESHRKKITLNDF